MKVHIIIPVYNEKDNIRQTLDEIEHAVSTSHDITIVYDFPEDNTLPVASRWHGAHADVDLRLLENDRGPGVVHAIKKGLAEVSDGAALVVMADLSDDLRAVDSMAERIAAGYDVVCGSRYMAGGRQVGGQPFKKFLSRLAGLSLHLLTGIATHDITNSFKMYSARLLGSIVIESRGGFEVGLEILVKCFAGGGRITEVPSVWRDRTAGESRFRLWRWLPHYLKWYLYALGYRLGLVRSRPLS